MLLCKKMICSGCLTAGILVSSWSAAPAQAQLTSASRDDAVAWRIDFDFPESPPATVEVDLNHGMMSAISGIGQAAVGGVVEGLLESEPGRSTPEVAKSAEHLQAVNQILSELTGVVHEVRVRVYDNLGDAAPELRGRMVDHYVNQLKGSSWDNVVRVHDHGSKVNVNVLRENEAIRGLFVIVSEQNQFIMANVVCDLTPERIKQVSHGATTIGMKFGLDRAIKQAMTEMERELH